ncbi:hypothetical protein FNF27_03823 [Cafeteria roenbergensis]|uniref:Uncharacterized protein n=1 Tax=Cafeteria roenbergensis TaxID=33653 RepID=A0A5A8EFG4_CAFRO|nr:hypothetical protein FNF27_03823 [Cafeteria roenbergensis]
MPATAGRVRMPANNRQSTSSALQTNAIWQTVVGYDPYKGTGEDPAGSAAAGVAGAGRKTRALATDEQKLQGEGLMELARLQKSEMATATGPATRMAAAAAAAESRPMIRRRNRLGFEAATALGWRPDAGTFKGELSDRALDAAATAASAAAGAAASAAAEGSGGMRALRGRLAETKTDGLHGTQACI